MTGARVRDEFDALVEQARASDMIAVALAHGAQLRKSSGEFVVPARSAAPATIASRSTRERTFSTVEAVARAVVVPLIWKYSLATAILSRRSSG
jgi:hypothetical protein